MCDIQQDSICYKINSNNEASVNGLVDKQLSIPVNIPEFITDEDGDKYKVTTVSQYAFFETQITSLSLPSTIKEIESGAFDRCSGLKGSLQIPQSVEILRSQSFSSTSYEYVYIPKSVTLIEGSALCTMPNLKKFIVDTENENYCHDKYGCLYSKNMTVLIQYILSLPFYELNINTIQISYKSSLGLTQPKIIHIPPHVLYFEAQSFTISENIQEVHIHSQWFEASLEAFKFCDSTKVYYYGSKIQDTIIIGSGNPNIFVSNKYLSDTFSNIKVTHLTHFPQPPILTCKSRNCYHNFNLFIISFIWK